MVRSRSCGQSTKEVSLFLPGTLDQDFELILLIVLFNVEYLNVFNRRRDVLYAIM